MVIYTKTLPEDHKFDWLKDATKFSVSSDEKFYGMDWKRWMKSLYKAAPSSFLNKSHS